MMRPCPANLVVSLLLAACAIPAEPGPVPDSALGRAITYLRSEVPRWPREEGCFSCHHNGDAARALYLASAAGVAEVPASLAETTAFLRDSSRWEENSRGTPYEDRVLACVQFASGLAAAIDAGLVHGRKPLARAAARLGLEQERDGHWAVDAAGSVGSPATYGSFLATAQAVIAMRRVPFALLPDDPAERWLRRAAIHNVPQAAAAILALHDRYDDAASAQVARALALLLAAQGSDGGFGPFATDAPEAFDTALAVLALSRIHTVEATSAAVRGRAYLIATQRADGSWRETTRPAGSRSLPQRVSTVAWAMQALLATEPRRS